MPTRIFRASMLTVTSCCVGAGSSARRRWIRRATSPRPSLARAAAVRSSPETAPAPWTGPVEQPAQLEPPPHQQGRLHVPRRQRPLDCQRLPSSDEALPPQRPPDELDHLLGQVREVGDRLLLDDAARSGLMLFKETGGQIPRICFFFASNSSSVRIPWFFSCASCSSSAA